MIWQTPANFLNDFSREWAQIASHKMCPFEQLWDLLKGNMEIVTIAALIIGPFFAVMAAEYMRKKSEREARRLHVFKTLMSTRSLNLVPAHIDAINFIELEFFADHNVMKCWRHYRSHLDEYVKNPSWEIERKNRLNDLLFEISKAIGLPHNKSAIEKGVYYPKWFGEVDSENNQIRQLWLKTLKGEQPFRMKVDPITVEEKKPE